MRLAHGARAVRQPRLLMATPVDPYHFDVAGYHFDVSKVLGRYYLIVNHDESSSAPCASLLEAINKSEAYVKEHGER